MKLCVLFAVAVAVSFLGCRGRVGIANLGTAEEDSLKVKIISTVVGTPVYWSGELHDSARVYIGVTPCEVQFREGWFAPGPVRVWAETGGYVGMFEYDSLKEVPPVISFSLGE